MRTHTLSWIVAGGLLVGCTQDAKPPASRASKQIGPEGGTLSLGTLRLAIPRGALNEDTEISVETLAGEVPEAAVSAAYRFEPDGLHFSVPAELRMPLERVPAHAIFVTDTGSQIERTEAALGEADGEAVATGPIEHFSNVATERATSACYWTFDGVPDAGCSIEGKDTYVKWMIDDTYGRSDRQLTTMIHFKGLQDELVILQSFEVKNGTNVTTRYESEGVHFEDHTKPRFDTGGIRVLWPFHASGQAFHAAKEKSGEPMKARWVSGDFLAHVVPEDDLKPMSYDFVLKYRIAGNSAVMELRGSYQGHASRICPLGGCIADDSCGAGQFCANKCCLSCEVDPMNASCKPRTAGTDENPDGEPDPHENPAVCTAWSSECATSIAITREDGANCAQAVVVEGTNSCSYDAIIKICMEGYASDSATELYWNCILGVASDGSGSPVPANAPFRIQGISHACRGTGVYKVWTLPYSELETGNCTPKADGSNKLCNSSGQCRAVTPAEP